MIHRIALASALVAASLIPAIGRAQTQILSTAPPTVEYQYQMYYPRLWGWPGPGLSVGGSLPSQGREGISSFYGRPFPVPLGAGVYVNPFTYATQLPGPPNSFGLATNSVAPAYGPNLTAQQAAQGGGSPAGIYSPGSPMTLPQSPLSTLPQPPFSNLPQATQGGLQQIPQGSQVRPDLSRRPVPVTSLPMLEKGRQMMAIGDEKLQSRQWLQAYVNYQNAVFVADDLADAHVRLAIASLALNRWPEAAEELKRALFIDPTAARPGETLATILGPDSQSVRAEMTRSVALWAREDVRDQDRLFLLGAVLRFEGDKRAPEILQAAYKITGSGDHLLALMPTPAQPAAISTEAVPPVPMPPESQKLPELHQRPLALH